MTLTPGVRYKMPSGSVVEVLHVDDSRAYVRDVKTNEKFSIASNSEIEETP